MLINLSFLIPKRLDKSIGSEKGPLFSLLNNCFSNSLKISSLISKSFLEINPKKANLYKYRAESKSKLGDKEGADEDDKKADQLKSMWVKYEH